MVGGQRRVGALASTPPILPHPRKYRHPTELLCGAKHAEAYTPTVV